MAEYKKLKYRYFTLSFAASFLVLSILFLTLVNYVHPRIPQALSPQKRDITDGEPAWSPGDGDSLTVLLMARGGENSPPGVYLLMRFDPVRGGVPVVALAPETVMDNNGKSETLSEIYTYGGAGYTLNAIARTLNIKIDRYVRISAEAFIQCADIIGSTEFILKEPVDIIESGVNILFGEGAQLLDGSGISQLVIWDSKRTPADSRGKLTSGLAAAIVNQHMDIISSDSADRIFERIVNLVDTDISYADYINHKAALSHLALNVGGPAVALPVLGDYNEEGTAFTMSDTFLALLAQSFA